MHNQQHKMLISLLTALCISGVIGLMFGKLGWGLAVGAIIWALYQVRHFSSLINWLEREDDSEPPEAPGHWGSLLDELSRLQKRHRNRERDLRSVIIRFQQSSAALQDGVVIIDNNNNLEWWNRSADRLLGLKAASDRGKPVMNLLRDPRFIRYYKKGNYEDPIDLPGPTNPDIRLQYQISSFGNNDRLLVVRDITRLIRLEQTRQDFVANASHELRTPLTVIRGYLETFLDQDLPRPMARALGQMQTQSKRMENLVSDLLLLSRLESSHHISDENPVHIHNMMLQIQQDATELGRSQGHVISLEADPQFDLAGHEVELHSSFSNLVFNAVRYTPSDGDIVMRWWVDDKGGHFSVTDNGIGIDSVHLPRLTERFYRVDESRSSASGGTGLGLAIVKHVLVRHGAQLSVESRHGEGSTFTCHFPPELVLRSEPASAESLTASADEHDI